MADSIRLAFAHPDERAIATEGDAPRDRISLRDHVVTAEIGAFQTERGARQRLRFNVVVEVAPADMPLDDDVDRILSYDRVTDAIAAELAAERLNLLETLAERVAERILREPRAMRAFVRVEKLDRGPGALGVEIVRTRRDRGDRIAALPDEAARDRPHPRVVLLSNAAIADARLPGWLDALSQARAPVILCTGLPDLPAPPSGHPMTDRRIALLAQEQNAWCLAARDPRCTVVATRTELDWAMRQGRISVWAPSKLVLDAAVPPAADATPAALAAWFAAQMDACELLTLGLGATLRAEVPVRALPLDAPLL